MDEQSLRVFLSLAETENTRDTAAMLRSGQSNVSRALARLENAIGIELFTRSGRRLVLNSRGASFRADAAAVLDSLEAARRHAESLADEVQAVRIGFLHSLARWMVPSAIGRFRAVKPQARVSLRQGFSADLYAWLDADIIDVALCTAPLLVRRELTWVPTVREQLCIAAPANHSVSAKSSATLADIDGQDFIGFSRIAELHAVVGRLLTEAETSVTVTFESSEIETMRALVAGGLGVSVLPRPHYLESPEVRYVPLDPPQYRELGIAWRAKGQGSQAVLDFVNAVLAETVVS